LRSSAGLVSAYAKPTHVPANRLKLAYRQTAAMGPDDSVGILKFAPMMLMIQIDRRYRREIERGLEPARAVAGREGLHERIPSSVVHSLLSKEIHF
jgi:hypothetical protein